MESTRVGAVDAGIRPFVGEGNHFATWQEPDIVTTQVRAAFRSLRQRRSS